MAVGVGVGAGSVVVGGGGGVVVGGGGGALVVGGGGGGELDGRVEDGGGGEEADEEAEVGTEETMEVDCTAESSDVSAGLEVAMLEDSAVLG